MSELKKKSAGLGDCKLCCQKVYPDDYYVLDGGKLCHANCSYVNQAGNNNALQLPVKSNFGDAIASAMESVLKNAEDVAYEAFLDSRPSGDAGELQVKFKLSRFYREYLDDYNEQISALEYYKNSPA